MNTTSLAVRVSLSHDTLCATIEDRRDAALSVFAPLNESQRTGLVADAWSIGLRALTNAYKQAEESRLVDIGATLKQDVEKQLADYIEQQQAAFVQVLARYFNPQSGQVVARLDAFPTFARYGNDVLVVWDENDEATNPYLHAGLLLGLALASRQRRPDDAGDIAALADIEHRIQAELTRFDRMRKLAESIRDDAEKLGEEVRKGAKGLDLLLRKAKTTLKALNVELTEAEDSRTAPVLLSATSLSEARAALVTPSANDAEAEQA